MNDYIIIEHWNKSEFEAAVCSKLRMGYVPVGGVSVVSSNPGQYLYVQAMMKA